MEGYKSEGYKKNCLQQQQQQPLQMTVIVDPPQRLFSPVTVSISFPEAR